MPLAQNTDVDPAGLSIFLTCVYPYGLIFRPKAKVAGMGIDSLGVLVLAGLRVVGLFAIPAPHGG